MRHSLVRYTLLALVGLTLAACGDDSTDIGTLGTPSDVRVRAYLEVDGNGQFDAATDDALAGVTVTLEHTQTGDVVEAETGSDGLALFPELPAGAYNAALDPADLPAGLTDVAIVDPGMEQTIVAPFEGAETGVDAAFSFRYMPATIRGTVYQDVDRSGDYDPAIDVTTAAGVKIYLYAGEEATGTPQDSMTTGSDGEFSFEVYPATYTVDVAADAMTEVVTATPVTTTVGATEEFETTVVVRSAVQTIASAESQADDAAVLVDGIVTVDRGTISGSYFWIQDATGGIKVYIGGSWEGDYVRGDSLRVQGVMATNFGERSIEATSIEALGTAAVPAATLMDAAELLTADHQGELVTVDSLLVDSVGTGSSYNAYVTDPSTGDEFVVRVDSDTGIGEGAFVAGQRYTVTGVSSPFGGQEQILVRSAADIFSLDGGPISLATARAQADSTAVTVEGVVHTATGTISGAYFFMHDGTAGIKVYVGDIDPTPAFARGDSVEVSGEVITRFGEQQIEATAVTVLGTGTVRDPIVVTGAELLTAATQGNLVTVQTVTVDAVGTGSSYNATVTDPATSTSFVIRVDSDTGIGEGAFTVGERYTVTGVSSPFGGAEQVYPRSAEDIVLIPAPVDIVDAKAETDSTLVTVEGVVHTATGTISGAYYFMHDATAGIKVYIGGLDGSPTFARGDSVEVTGEVITRFGEQQIEAVSVTVHGTGTVRDPIVVTGAELLTAVTQGNLVTVETVTVDAVGTGSSYNVTVTDPESSTSFVIRIDSDTGIGDGVFTVGGSYTVTGVSSPFGGAEQVYPRSAADITTP